MMRLITTIVLTLLSFGIAESVKVCSAEDAAPAACLADKANETQIDLHVWCVEIDQSQAHLSDAVRLDFDHLGLGVDTATTPRICVLEDSKQASAALQNLAECGVAKMLSVPVLRTIEGQSAYFQCGGEIPILKGASSRTVSIDYKQIGAEFRVTPRLTCDSQIDLDLDIRHVKPDANLTTQIDGISYPGFSTQQIEATRRLPVGGTIFVSGLRPISVEAATPGELADSADADNGSTSGNLFQAFMITAQVGSPTTSLASTATTGGDYGYAANPTENAPAPVAEVRQPTQCARRAVVVRRRGLRRRRVQYVWQSAPAQPQREVVISTKIFELNRSKIEECGLEGNSFTQFIVAQSKIGDSTNYGAAVLEGGSELFKAVDELMVAECARVVAEPTVMTVIGRPVQFACGGEVPASSGGNSQNSSATIRVGTQLDCLVTALAGGKLRVEARPRFSEIDPEISFTIGEIDPETDVETSTQTFPGLRTFMIDASAEMRAGQMLVLHESPRTRSVENADGDESSIETQFWALISVDYADADPSPRTAMRTRYK